MSDFDNKREAYRAAEEASAEPPARKVIQISSVMDSVGKYLILAVCNDGTIWSLTNLYEGDPKWKLYVQPPQP